MKKFTKLICSIVIVISITMFASCTSNSSNDIVIIVDGGGQNASFNSTVSMIYDEYANPYPYKTLQTLADEWNSSHSGYKISIASSSINNDRETMVPALNQGTAPDILYYLPTTIAEDMSKGWFVDLTDYLTQPNKYSKQGEAGSTQWKDIYNAEEYATTIAPNGEKYTVELEQNPIGIIYNKTLFNLAGISKEPTTFKEFMEAQDALYAYAASQGKSDSTNTESYICPYFPYYSWYDMCIKSSIYGEMIDYYDVIDNNGVVNSEEFVRAYMTKDNDGNRLFSPNDSRNIEVYRLIKLMTKYYPASFESYYAEQQFTIGNLAMMEVTGGTIRKIVDAVGDSFEVGVFSYPKIETQPTDKEYSEYYSTMNTDNYYVRRGMSGYSTGWSVTKTAMNKGNDVVDVCVDFLQYASCYSNNDRMINDKGFSIPLSGNTNYSYFSKLSADYQLDINNEKSLAWSAVCDSNAMNKEYYDAVYLTRIEIIKAANSTAVKSLLDNLVSNFTNAANSLYTVNKWDKNTWPTYTDTI
jgi:ABC-type glycerol-3-phosphate transport system substrate-binding protein